MNDFQTRTYNYILDLFTDPQVRTKAMEVLTEFGSPFFKNPASPNKGLHQCYDGGLADHTALCCLAGYFLAFTNPLLGLYLDDVLVACMFHDLNKIRKGMEDDETCTILGKFGLLNETVRHGVVYAHGGWSKARRTRHRPIAVIVHCADMIAAHVFRHSEDTKAAIKQYRQYIDLFRLEEADMPIPKPEKPRMEHKCPKCGGSLMQVADPKTAKMSPFWDCLKCRLRYTIKEPVVT